LWDEFVRAFKEAGAIDVSFLGCCRFYRARGEALKPVADILEEMWSDALWRLKLQAELEETRRGPSPKRARTKRQKP
jgi:hypothetical protein